MKIRLEPDGRNGAILKLPTIVLDELHWIPGDVVEVDVPGYPVNQDELIIFKAPERFQSLDLTKGKK